MRVAWKDEPDDHDYPAARDYLTLHYGAAHAEHIVHRLEQAHLTTRKAKDILRASSLPHLPADNVHVAADIEKARREVPLSPVLLVRGRPMLIADGYHRVCASYHLAEDTDIPCKIVSP